jgi:hypothetical protein
VRYHGAELLGGMPMTDLPIPSSAKSLDRVIWKWLFADWVVMGSLLVAMSVVCRYQCPDLPSPERRGVFKITDPKKLALIEEYERCVGRLIVLARGALIYGLLGVIVFFRRGCIVFIVAGSVLLACGFAWVDATWVDL